MKHFAMLLIIILPVDLMYAQIPDNPYISPTIGLANEYDNYGANGDYYGRDMVAVLSAALANGVNTVQVDLQSFNSHDELQHASNISYTFSDNAMQVDASNYALPFIDQIYKGETATSLKDNLSTLTMDAVCEGISYPLQPYDGETLPGGPCDITMHFKGGDGLLHFTSADRKISIGSTRIGCSNIYDVILISSTITMSLKIKIGGLSVRIFTNKEMYVMEYYKYGYGNIKTVTYEDAQYSRVISYRVLNMNFQPHADHLELVNTHYDVPLYCQATEGSCWATSIAMILAWQQQTSVSAHDLAYSQGYISEYDSFGLSPVDFDFLIKNGFEVDGAGTYSIDYIKQLLNKYGPLLVVVGPADPAFRNNHDLVLTALRGDGTPCGTMLRFNDPWPASDLPSDSCIGQTFELTFEEFNTAVEHIARPPISSGPQPIWENFGIAHLRKKL